MTDTLLPSAVIAPYPQMLLQPDWKKQLTVETQELVNKFSHMRLSTAAQAEEILREKALTKIELTEHCPDLAKVVDFDAFSRFMDCCLLSVFQPDLDDRLSHRRYDDTSSHSAMLKAAEAFFKFHDEIVSGHVTKHVEKLNGAENRK